jgi:hypothetical protein
LSQETIQKSFKVKTPANIKISNIRGSIVLKQGKGQEIQIEAIKHLDSYNPDDTSIEIFQSEDGTVNVITRYDHSGSWNLGSPCKIEYEISTPKETTARVNTVSGSAIVEGLYGNHKIKSVSGALEITNLSGEIFAKTVSGKLSGNNLTGPAKLKTVSGKIRVEESSIQSLSISTVSGNTIIHTDIGDGPYQISSVSGSTKLIVPENSKCSAHARSISGRFRTDLNVSSSIIKRRSWDVHLEGGGTEIHMNSVSGSLYILTSENAEGRIPHTKRISREQRLDILQKLEGGELSVEETIVQLSR